MGDVLNVGGITKTSYTDIKQILFDAHHFLAVPIMLDNTAKNDDGVCLAGTPLAGDLLVRATPFVKAAVVGSTKGVYTIQITTAFEADETLVIDGVTYTAKAVESVAKREFAVGANAAAQVTSLAKMVVSANFVVTAASDKLTFTQKKAGYGDAPVASKEATTGVIGEVTEATAPVVGTSNAVGVLLHDVTLGAAGDKNAVMLIHGFVNYARLDSSVQALIQEAIKASLQPMVVFVQ